MNVIFEKSSPTKEEPVENKEENLANLLRTRRWYDLLVNVLPQSYDVEEHAANRGKFFGELKDHQKLANTGVWFEYQVVDAMKW